MWHSGHEVRKNFMGRSTPTERSFFNNLVTSRALAHSSSASMTSTRGRVGRWLRRGILSKRSACHSMEYSAISGASRKTSKRDFWYSKPWQVRNHARVGNICFTFAQNSLPCRQKKLPPNKQFSSRKRQNERAIADLLVPAIPSNQKMQWAACSVLHRCRSSKRETQVPSIHLSWSKASIPALEMGFSLSRSNGHHSQVQLQQSVDFTHLACQCNYSGWMSHCWCSPSCCLKTWVAWPDASQGKMRVVKGNGERDVIWWSKSDFV
jgi:hypothetical protein